MACALRARRLAADPELRDDHVDSCLRCQAEAVRYRTMLRQLATKRYKVYAKSVRHALQSLTGVQITRPHDWRRWWNTNKKKKKWGRSTDPGSSGKKRR